MDPQHTLDLVRPAVPQSQPEDLWRIAVQNAAFRKISVFGHDRETVDLPCPGMRDLTATADYIEVPARRAYDSSESVWEFLRCVIANRNQLRLLPLLAAVLCLGSPSSQAQDDGSATPRDGGGSGVLESIYVPNLPHAPFSLTLHTEWIQHLSNGGTFTEVNDRPIVRDSAGRIYMERWLLVPKGSDVPTRMTAIQIDDPVAHRFYTCFVRGKVCDLSNSVMGLAHYDASRVMSGPLQNGKGSFSHEDLGAGTYAGVPVHSYRDTTTINAGAFGNDVAMATTREFRYSAELGFNLTSTVDAPQVGREVFTVSDLNTNEPDPKYFQPPDGYRILDKRKPAGGAQPQADRP